MRNVARLISNVVSPPVVGVGLIISLSLNVAEGPMEALRWILLAIALAGAPPLLYVVYLVRTGYLADFHMPHREKRIKPLMVMVTWFLMVLILLYELQAPHVVILLLAATIFQVALLAAITLAWKISFHSAAIASAALLAVLMAMPTAWAVVGLVPFVAWSRVRLNRHTPWQVVFGCLAGAVVSFIVFSFISPYLLG